jgi:putative glutamine amidotransferase
MVPMNSRKPVIGVTTSRGRGRLMWWFNRFALWRAGARSIRLEPHRQFDRTTLDGLVLGGGDDIDADLYGVEVRPMVRVDPDRDALELELLQFATDQNLPVLGICRGSQMINVSLGGTLHGDIYDAYENVPRMRTPLPRKTIRLIPASRLHGIIDKSRDRVNALHHQSVARLGSGLRVAARDEHGIVQAIESRSEPFLLGVQWHPEFMVFDSGQQKLYRALVASARERKAATERPSVRSPSGGTVPDKIENRKETARC